MKFLAGGGMLSTVMSHRLAAALLLGFSFLAAVAGRNCHCAEPVRPQVEVIQWRPDPVRLGEDVRSHLESISHLLPSMSRGSLDVTALIATLQKRVTAPAATRSQICAGLALMRALKRQEDFSGLRKYLETAGSGRRAVAGMRQWSLVLRANPEARSSLASSMALIQLMLSNRSHFDMTRFEGQFRALFDGTLSRDGALPMERIAARETAVKPVPLSRAAAVMEGVLASGRAMAESDYRAMDPGVFFAGDETRRVDTLLSRQAAEPAQAMLEVIANGQDASIAEERKVGRFGVGGLQVFGELKGPGDRVLMETSKGGGRAVQFLFWRELGEVFFDYRWIESSRQGTLFRVFKKLGAEDVRERREFLERKLRANDRGRIVWKDGGRINRPGEFLEWGAGALGNAAGVAPVIVRLDASGYEIEDYGRGMGLKEIFERYLKPYGTDKPVSAGKDAARLFYRGDAGPEPTASLGVATVEIERVPLSSGGRRLNLAGDVFIDLPHDTDLTEDRGLVSLVSADQSMRGAIRGLRLLIDRLADPSVHDPVRFSILNSLAALLREKQPAHEKGLTRGDPDTATDLLWYLSHRLERSGLLELHRGRGAAFLPNSARWSPLEGLSDKIIFLDEALFSPTPEDFAAAGFEEIPLSLLREPAWRAFQSRSGAKFFARTLRQDGPLAVVGDGVVVVDASLTRDLGDPEVLIARIEREMVKASGTAPPAPKSRWARLRSAALRRVIGPAVLAAVLSAVPALYHSVHAASASALDRAAGISLLDGVRLPPAGERILRRFQFPFLERMIGRGNPSPGNRWTAHFAGAERRSGWRIGWTPKAIAALRDAKPRQPFGTFDSNIPVERFFLNGIKTKLLEDGSWDSMEAQWSQGDGAAPDGVYREVDVRYLTLVDRDQAQRLLNQTSGRISRIDVRDTQGRALNYDFDPRRDMLTVRDYSGEAYVLYRIDLGPDVNAIEADDPLPDNEVRDFPRQWRRDLDAVKNAPDERKRAAIERLMARDFVYDASKPYNIYDKTSWGHKAQLYLDARMPIPIVCDTSSLYYYLMARYVGLPAAYVGLEDSEKGVFYKDLVGHAQAMIRVDGRWRVVETTSLMPLKVAAPRVLPSPGGSGGAAPIVLSILILLAAALGAVLGVVATLRWSFHLHRALRPLRTAWSLFGRRWERLPGTWLLPRWRPLGGKGPAERMFAPWGTLYRKAWARGRAYALGETGDVRPLSISGGETQVAGRQLLFVSRRLGLHRIMVFDGSKLRAIGRPFWSRPRLLATPGSRRYAVVGKKVFHLDAEAARCEPVMELPYASIQVAAIESRGEADRFAVLRWGWHGGKLRSFTVSGGRGRWDGPEQVVGYVSSDVKLSAWPAGQSTVYEIVDGIKEIATDRLVVSGQGEVPLSGRVWAVLGGKVFVSGAEGLEAYDIASRRWTEARLGEMEVSGVHGLARDLFVVRGLQEGRERFLFCDYDGGRVADIDGWLAAAVRQGDVVYYRMAGKDRLLYAARGDAPVRTISLDWSPEPLYSLACARATGLDPSLFRPLDGESWEPMVGDILASRDAKAFRKAAKRDRPWIGRLAPEIKSTASFRTAMMPEWSLAHLFLSPEAARAPIAAQARARLDQLVRDNISRPDWLRRAFELVDRVYRLGIDSPSVVVGHYIDMIGAVPELLDDLREAVLEPISLVDGARVEPVGYLYRYDPRRAQGLPPATQLYLQMLKNGPESLLRRESEGAPQGPPAFVLDGRGESLSRLIAAARKLSEEQIDRAGLEGFARVFHALSPRERADLSSIRGVVMNQGLSAPVWVRELVQNARDAVREARRAGRDAAATVRLRSFLSQDGSRWIVSVRDGAGMRLSRLLKALLVPEATTKTLADEVREVLSSGGGVEASLDRLLEGFFDEAARSDEALLAFLREAVAAGGRSGALRIAERLSERMRKAGAGFFGIGFFTVFGGADEVIVRTGSQGRLREVALAPERDESGRVTDIRLRFIRDYEDPDGARAGTEVLRVKNATAQNIGRLLVENAYLHIMARKYVGAVSDVALSLNAEPLRDDLASAGVRDGLRSRLGRGARPRWTVDELYVQEPPLEGLALVPEEVLPALRAAGWNLDFPAATPVVRTRAAVQNPRRYAAAAASLALRAAHRLYKEGAFAPPGLPSYEEYRSISPWDSPPPVLETREDAAAVAAGSDTRGLWERYQRDPRRWSQLMLAVCDDKERALRRILGPELCAALDELRGRGQPARVGPLPPEGAEDYENEVRNLHAAALSGARRGGGDLDLEPAAAGLARVFGVLASFLEDPPPFVPARLEALEAVRRFLNEGAVVPLMDALLECCGRTCDAEAVRLFEGWLKGRNVKQALEVLFLGDVPRVLMESSTAKLRRAASRGRPALISLPRTL
ncbi:MAG: hypothetical protein HY551_06900 [Elusimicrobia bacterium]|nr:hypothetical protein [Elusimicrobiota bacterium]